MTGTKPLPKRFLHIVRSRASSFNWQYSLMSLRSSGSFLRLLPRLLVTSICPFIFPSITCCRRQFLRKTWPIQSASLLLNTNIYFINKIPSYLIVVRWQYTTLFCLCLEAVCVTEGQAWPSCNWCQTCSQHLENWYMKHLSHPLCCVNCDLEFVLCLMQLTVRDPHLMLVFCELHLQSNF